MMNGARYTGIQCSMYDIQYLVPEQRDTRKFQRSKMPNLSSLATCHNVHNTCTYSGTGMYTSRITYMTMTYDTYTLHPPKQHVVGSAVRACAWNVLRVCYSYTTVPVTLSSSLFSAVVDLRRHQRSCQFLGVER